MIYSKTHGAHPFRSSSSMFAFANMNDTFQYLFPAAPEVSHDATTVSRLDALAEEMISKDTKLPSQNSSIPPIFTYFGQFIDHDITAGTDGDPELFTTEDDNFSPIDRDKVQNLVRNQRTAMLDLDSIYGGDVLSESFDEKLKGLMRHPRFPGKMLIGFPETSGGPFTPDNAVDLPKDRAADQLRLHLLLGDELTETELRALSDGELRKLFFFAVDDPDNPGNLIDGKTNPYRAIIGDARNDENLFVSQFHLAIIRLHNKVVDACDDKSVINAGSDALFEWARQKVRWIYQWLVVNEYLSTVCDPAILSEIIKNKAPLYAHFLKSTRSLSGRRLPMPFEFSAGAYRFGHTMVRQEYNWNKFFPNAGFFLLFQFTGSVKKPMFLSTDGKLPSNWVADWSRLSTLSSGNPDQAARKIDTNLSFELGQLPPQADGTEVRPIPNLAKANLRKSHLLNLPSAQGCFSSIENQIGTKLPQLTDAQLSKGKTGAALENNGLLNETPIWFYVLKEAEVLHQGDRLGPLGTTLIADTILGLLMNDPQSYWNQPGSDPNGRWRPEDTVNVSGVTVNSLQNMLKAALVL